MNQENKIELQPKYPPPGKFLQNLTGFFAVAMIVFFIMGQTDYLRTKVSLFLMAVSAVFLLVHPLRWGIRALNLRPFLHVPTRIVQPGEEFAFDWKLKTGPFKISRLSITLEGKKFVMKPLNRNLYNMVNVEEIISLCRVKVIRQTGRDVRTAGAAVVQIPGKTALKGEADVIWWLRVDYNFRLLGSRSLVFPITDFSYVTAHLYTQKKI